MILKYIQSDTSVYTELYSSLLGVLLKFIRLILMFTQGIRKFIRLIMMFIWRDIRLMLTFIDADVGNYTE